MKKTLILLTGCGLLGGCMATVSPRGDVAVSYAVPVVQEEIVTPSYVAYAGSSVTYVSPLSVWFHRSYHKPPRPIVNPRPHVPVVHHVQPAGHHPGGNGGHHVGGNGHQPGNGHNPGGNNGPSHPGNGHGGNHGPSNPGHGGNGGNSHPGHGNGGIGGGGGHTPQQPSVSRPNMSQLRINR